MLQSKAAITMGAANVVLLNKHTPQVLTKGWRILTGTI